ncbi:MAG: imidazole glycerol phosphate synthase subunit HisF [Deltaproteobacteria bacterium]|nr:imidazole glycerol phosphate synthase subunit HisF [Deltaproteobacteria bacterium]
MVPVRVIPVLLLQDRGLVKTVRFAEPKYVGDPRNAVRIFNEKEVDELVLLDVGATPAGTPLQFDLVREIVSEAFMPVAYGGGIRTIEDARRMLALGVEKIVLCSHAIEDPRFVREAADVLGSQSVVVCLDVKKGLLGGYELMTHGGRKRARLDPVRFAREVESLGAGEIVVNSIDRDGTRSGFDLELVRAVADAVRVPVIACGGAGTVEHLGEAVREGGASAVAAGSLFVFQGPHRAVLISYPKPEALRRLFGPDGGRA